MDKLLDEILEAADRAVDERWHVVGEVTGGTMVRLRALMERWHAARKEAEGAER